MDRGIFKETILAQERVVIGVNFRKINNNWKNFTWFLTELGNSCCQHASVMEVNFSSITTTLVCELRGWYNLRVLHLIWRAQGREVTCDSSLEWTWWDSLSPWTFLGLLWYRQSSKAWPESGVGPIRLEPSGLPWLTSGVGLTLYGAAELPAIIDPCHL